MRCRECGATSSAEAEECPLCGAELAAKKAAPAPKDVDSYHANVRKLREQLEKIRNDEAEAV